MLGRVRRLQNDGEKLTLTWFSNELVSAAVELHDILVEEGEQPLEVGIVGECTA